MKKKILLFLLFLTIMTLTLDGAFISKYYTLAEEDEGFAVYCNKVEMSNSATINGNVGITSSGKLEMTNSTQITGTLYKGNNVQVTYTNSATVQNGEVSLGTELIYDPITFAGLPTPDPETLPDRGSINAWGHSRMISEDGYYPYITLDTMTVDVTQENRFIRIDTMNIKKIVLNGSHKLFLFVNEMQGDSTWQSEINKNGQPSQVHMYVHQQNSLSLGQVEIKASIYAPNANKIHLSNDSSIYGNIITKNVELSNNSDDIHGFVYIPGYTLTMSNSSLVNGKVVAKSVKMSNSSEINNDGSISLDIPGEIIDATKEITYGALTPSLDGVTLNGDGTCNVSWGYNNENSQTITVNQEDSVFTGETVSGGTINPITTFEPGEHHNVFTTTFTSDTFTWSLTGPDGETRTVTASKITAGAITPIVNSIVENDDGTCTVSWGYENSNSQTVTILQENSAFTSGNVVGGITTPITSFDAGVHNNVFTTTFDSEQLTWSLKGPDGITRTITANRPVSQPVIQNVATVTEDGQTVFEVTHSLVDNAVSYDIFIDGAKIDESTGYDSNGTVLDRDVLADKGVIRFITGLNVFDITVKPNFADGTYGQVSDAFSVNRVSFSVSNPVESNIVSKGVFFPDEEIPYAVTIKNCKGLSNVTLGLDLNIGSQNDMVKYIPWTQNTVQNPQDYIQVYGVSPNVNIGFSGSGASGSDIHLQLKLNNGNALTENAYTIKFKLKMKNNGAVDRENVTVQNNISLNFTNKNSMVTVTNESYIEFFPFDPILQ